MQWADPYFTFGSGVETFNSWRGSGRYWHGCTVTSYIVRLQHDAHCSINTRVVKATQQQQQQ